MSRGTQRAGAALALFAALGAGHALADWRDFMGKTLVLEVKTNMRSVNDIITARGGASSADEVSTSTCDMSYRLYLSGKGRLFMHAARIHCAGSSPYSSDEVSGRIYDLTVPEGRSDAGPTEPSLPYSIRIEGDEVVIDQLQTDYVSGGNGSVITTSNSSGSFATRVRFAQDCAMSISGSASYRMEFRSTNSDYYVLQDTDWTYDMKTVSCRVVDGFAAK